jgi:hypothetical protein
MGLGGDCYSKPRISAHFLASRLAHNHLPGIVIYLLHTTACNLVVAVRLAREEAFLWSLAGAKGFSYLLSQSRVV